MVRIIQKAYPHPNN